MRSLSVLGLVFLSRWFAPDSANEVKDCPNNLWFANQISTFSCATLAMINIINNQENVNLGPELQRFKQETWSMTPKERGIKLDDFQFVKDVHNSFSSELDRLAVDLRLKEEAQASARKSKKSKKKLTTRKKRRTHAEEDYESGFHFVAYVPAQGHVWKLDGLEQYPRDMGRVDSSDNWLMHIISDIQNMLDGPEGDDTEFSLLSLDRETSSDLTVKDNPKVARMKEDWGPFIAHMLRLHSEKGDLDDLIG